MDPLKQEGEATFDILLIFLRAVEGCVELRPV